MGRRRRGGRILTGASTMFDKPFLPGGQCNYVVKLREHCRKNSLNLELEFVSSSGPPHKPTFVFRAVINGENYPDGSGNSKREARSNAAKLALEHPNLLKNPKLLKQQSSKQQSTSASTATVEKGSTHTVPYNTECIDFLHDFANKRNMAIKCIESHSRNPLRFCCKWKIGDREFFECVGRSKYKVKQNAARMAYYSLLTEYPKKVIPVEDSTPASSSTTNYVSLLLDYAQKRNMKIDAIESRSAHSISSQYCCKWKLGDRELGAVYGTTVEEAKQNAAKLAYNVLVNEDTLKVTSVEDSTPAPSSTTNYVSLLRDYAQKRNMRIDAIESPSGPSFSSQYCYKWKFGDRELGAVYGMTVEEAKQNAAKFAYNVLVNEDTLMCDSTDRSSSQPASSVGSENRNFSLRPKTDNQVGQALGNSGNDIVEPTPLNFKTGRNGTEQDDQKKRKAKDQPQYNIKKIKEEEEEFRLRFLRMQEEKSKVIGDLRKSQCACLQLDKQKGKREPKKPWFWPKFFITEDDDDEEDEDTEKKGGLSDLEKLQILTAYLRRKHFYCIWCGTAYDDKYELSSRCPGSSSEVHK